MTLALGKININGRTQMLVQCSACEMKYGVAPRTLRDMRLHGRLPICPMCRNGHSIVVGVEERLYWLDRFTIKEIRELSDAIFGPLPD